MTDRAVFAAELAGKLTDEVNSHAVQEFLEAKGVHYDHTDIDETQRIVEQDVIYGLGRSSPCADLMTSG